MHHFRPSATFHARGVFLIATAMLSGPCVAARTGGTHVFRIDLHDAVLPRDTGNAWEHRPWEPRIRLPFAQRDSLPFATDEDADAFQDLLDKAEAVPAPDARTVAKAFIRERLGIDGDAYVVAHFATAEQRSQGVPDRTSSLTEALMEAFPDHSRHGVFAILSDAVGGLNNGGQGSVGVVGLVDSLAHASDAKSAFAKLGLFLWSRTGPGYLYNTFFAKGNVIATVGEDYRSLDEAFGIYRVGGFTMDDASPLLLSQLVETFGAPTAFSELPYVKRLHDDLSAYWDAHRSDWAVLARYAFVAQAREARRSRWLTAEEYGVVMQGGAPGVPLDGPVTLAQLRTSQPGDRVEVRRFDINGYAATNLVRFIAADKSEVLYVPGGDPAFVPAGSEHELRKWVLDQAMHPKKLDDLMAHFSMYDGQDSMFWTGVRHGLENLATGRWQADAGTIDHANAAIAGDVFEDMQVQTGKRLRDDARLQASTAWEAWRGTIDRTTTLLAPLGFIRSLAIPFQVATGLVGVGTGIEQGIDGRTADERKGGLEQVASTVVNNVPMAIAYGGAGKAGEAKGAAVKPGKAQASFIPPRRVNGRIGYPLSPTAPPGWRSGQINGIYRRADGSLGRWMAADIETHTSTRLPTNVNPIGRNMFIRGRDLFVRWGEEGRIARVIADNGTYRLALLSGRPGPVVEMPRGGTWQFADGGDNYVRGSALSNLVTDHITVHPGMLDRAAEILEQFGVPETSLRLVDNAIPGPARPLVALALANAFVETLPARLRDPSAMVWSTAEAWTLTPDIVEQSGRPLAVYRADGGFDWALLPDGTELSATDPVPATAIRLQARGGRYIRLGTSGRARGYRSIFAAVADAVRTGESGSRAEREADFRRRLADTIEARSSDYEFQRMYRMWVDTMPMPGRLVHLLEDISALRRAIARNEPLTPAQRQRLGDAGNDELRKALSDNAASWRALAMRALPGILEDESALLPAGLDHLVVKDGAVLESARRQAAEHWSEGSRHYVRLRSLDGRTQVVETAPTSEDGIREILTPGEGADRGTGRHVVDVDGMYYPEDSLREGFAFVNLREYVEAIGAIAAKLPAAAHGDFASAGRIVDSIPQPLLRFFRTHFVAMDVADDKGLLLTARHPRLGLMRYRSRVDVKGEPVPRARPATLPPERPAPAVPDRELPLPVPEGLAGVSHGPSPDPAIYRGLVEGERPISAFVEAGAGTRHVKALVATRRLRGMLREDSHMAVVGATPDHVVTLLMPVNPETIDFAAPGGDSRPVAGLPEGTVIVDEMFGIRERAVDYPARLLEVASRWEAAGTRMKRTLSDGSEQRESPVRFASRVLSTPVRVNLWNPATDPITERAYVDYMRRRHANAGPVRRAGLDWLQTRKARRDYTTYFAPFHDVMPDGTPPPPTDLAASRMHTLAEAAIEAGLRPIATPVRPSTSVPRP